MSNLQWGAAAARVAGSIASAKQPDALAAARDAISETLQDWDSRHDWRFTQVVAPDIALTAADAHFDLPTAYKKPYVAYISGATSPLWYIERGNWHRSFPGVQPGGPPAFYTLYDSDSTGQGDLFPAADADSTLVVLYYRPITYTDDASAPLDILRRWEGYVLSGARGRLIGARVASEKAAFWLNMYELGIKQAKADDRRLPDQFLAFTPREIQANMARNPNMGFDGSWGVW